MKQLTSLVAVVALGLVFGLNALTVTVCGTAGASSYFQPYSNSNPNGYLGDFDRTLLERQLLARAENAVSSQIPASLVIDRDGDGYVDNICFIIQGSPDGWADNFYQPSCLSTSTQYYWRVAAKNSVGNSDYSQAFGFETGKVTDTDDPQVSAATTALKINYPNPFNPETTISYSLSEAQKVKIEVYNLRGQLVRTLVNDNQAAGDHKVIWAGIDNNNRAVASGIYYHKMTAGKYSSTRKMILMK